MRRYPSVRRLTSREREVALLFSDGLKPAVIAHRLNLTPQTVSVYLQRIKLRLDLATQADIVPWVTARRVPGHPDTLRRVSIDRLGQSAGRQQDDDGFRQRRDISH